MTADAQLPPARYVTVNLAAQQRGLSPGAVRKRIQRGLWVEGREWRRGPDGRIWVDNKAVDAWIETA